MYRSRRNPSLRRALSFGGRIPPSVGLLLVIIAIASLGSVIAGNVGWAYLTTGAVTRGEWWRLLSWAFVVTSPLALVFVGIGIYFFAPPLAYAFGERGLLVRLLFWTVGASLLTLLAGWLLGVHVQYLGIWAVLDGLVLTWALMNPEQRIMIYFVIPVSGRTMALLLVGLHALFAVWAVAASGLGGLVGVLPPIAALGLAWATLRFGAGLPLRRWRLGLREWRLERQLRRRSRHLQVVGKDGQQRGKQWMN